MHIFGDSISFTAHRFVAPLLKLIPTKTRICVVDLSWTGSQSTCGGEEEEGGGGNQMKFNEHSCKFSVKLLLASSLPKWVIFRVMLY